MLCRVPGTEVGLKAPRRPLSGWDTLETKKQKWNRLLPGHELQPLKTCKQGPGLYSMEIQTPEKQEGLNQMKSLIPSSLKIRSTG